jgi:hypothetical protein
LSKELAQHGFVIGRDYDLEWLICANCRKRLSQIRQCGDNPWQAHDNSFHEASFNPCRASAVRLRPQQQ